jgi:secreted trypsin-like serine protease
MNPACGYDYGGCDNEPYLVNNGDVVTYLQQRRSNGRVSYSDITGSFACPDYPPAGTRAATSWICEILRSATKEEYDMADISGDGLQSKEAFALYMMKIQTCSNISSVPSIKTICLANKDFFRTHVAIAMLNFAFKDESPSLTGIFEQYYGGAKTFLESLPRGSWKTWQKWHPKKWNWNNMAPVFNSQDREMLPNGQPFTLAGMVQYLADIDHLYAGGKDKKTWEPAAEMKFVNWTIMYADADGDGQMSRVEGFTLGFSTQGHENDLFHWLDMDSNGFVTKEEAFFVYDKIIKDGNNGKFVCNGLEIIDSTHGTINIRAPMGIKGQTCGWLILPSWFYGKSLNVDQSLSGAHSVKGRTSGFDNRSGSGSIPGNSTDAAEDKGFLVSFMGSYQVKQHICSGALISPDTVLSTASCIKSLTKEWLKQAEPDQGRPTIKIAGQSSNESFYMVDVLFHPSAFFEMAYDIALIKLDRPSNAKPVLLYDGGDLGVSDCKLMKLSYLSWPPVFNGSGLGLPTFETCSGGRSCADEVVDTLVQLVDHKNCQEEYHNQTGFDVDVVGTQEICVVLPVPTSSSASIAVGPCIGDLGLPLTARIQGSQDRVLLGLATNDDCGGGPTSALPAVFTRVSSSLQWIRANVFEISMHPEQFTMQLNVTEMGLPEGARVSVFNSASKGVADFASWYKTGPFGGLPSCSDIVTENCEIDSNCRVPLQTLTKHGAMLLILEMPGSNLGGLNLVSESGSSVDCNKECVETMGFKASFGLVPCSGCTSNCSLSVSWDRMGPHFQAKGKGYTGGLGLRTVKRPNREYGVWSCVRDWNESEQAKCGARHKDLACFWFEEKTSKFHFKGLNDEARLVTPEQYSQGLEMEANDLRGRTLSTSPDQAHV